MIKRIVTLLLCIICFANVQAQDRAITSGMHITRSTKIKKGIYLVDAPADTSKAVIVIQGNNIVIDFKGAELKGSNKKKTPDEFFGIAIYIRNSRNVTIKNLVAKGFKVALLGSRVENLVLENCDFSYNYRPRLNSTQEKEDVSDWMSYHQNEKDEWLRYGAGIYLRDCNFFRISRCKVTGGQNALLINRSNDGRIINNDFSFNSGIGIGMYRSSRNSIINNRVIFNVRGYSHGVYNRGQDSAGILLYEQSNDNLIYQNNVKFGGDGLFLWAGQTTMDTGKGGCNDNLIMGNDFSYAPTNGIEVTFSRNRIIDNKLYECDHGIWGGYSYETSIAGNSFRNNRIAIAIEHGQDIRIHNNLFSGDKEAIRLWARKEQPGDWGYARNRDTRSRNYVILGNSFNSNPVVYNISRTDSLNIFYNTYSSNTGELFKQDSTVSNLDTSYNLEWDNYFSSLRDTSIVIEEPLIDIFAEQGKLTGKKNILITEWGPYDFRSPVIWNRNPADSSQAMQFDLLGPAGKWVITSYRGIKKPSQLTGTFPSSITAEKLDTGRTDIYIQVKYTGAAIVTPFGEKLKAGAAYNFSFKKFFQPLGWEVLFYSLDTTYHNPVKTGSLFSMTEKKAPFRKEKKDRLDYAWWGGIQEGEARHRQFITIASARAAVPAGEYELSVTWDDAVRIYVDEKLVMNEWNPSRYKFDQSPNRKIRVRLKGGEQLRVEHLELGGFAALGVKLKKL